MTSPKTYNRKKSKNNRENKIFSIANKISKPHFLYLPIRNPLNFQVEKKGKNKNQKKLLIMLTNVNFFRKSCSKITKLKNYDYNIKQKEENKKEKEKIANKFEDVK